MPPEDLHGQLAASLLGAPNSGWDKPLCYLTALEAMKCLVRLRRRIKRGHMSESPDLTTRTRSRRLIGCNQTGRNDRFSESALRFSALRETLLSPAVLRRTGMRRSSGSVARTLIVRAAFGVSGCLHAYAEDLQVFDNCPDLTLLRNERFDASTLSGRRCDQAR